MSRVGPILDKKTFQRLRYGTWSTDLIVGVTGTELGMSDRQMASFWWLLDTIKPMGLRHGDCLGVDVQAAQIADSLKIPTFSHPGFNPMYPDVIRFRAFHNSTTVYDPKPFLKRDEDIARNVVLLIACPLELKEELRSGTWATIRYARKAGTPRIILLP